MKSEMSEIMVARRRRVIEAAQSEGLFDGKNSALGARVASRLLAQAKARSGIESTTELVAYALAKVALEDNFGAKLVARKGSIPADLELGV